MINNRPDGVGRDAGQRVFLGDPKSDGYRTFRAGIAEYVALMPPNSHGEANPADKDPVPPPFDNTYNSPEHDAFVLKVKYQRTDDFFTQQPGRGRRTRRARAGLDRPARLVAVPRRLPGHAARSLRASRTRRADRGDDAGADRGAAAAVQAARQEAARALRRRHARRMTHAEPGHVADALTFASRAWRRPLTPGRDRRACARSIAPRARPGSSRTRAPSAPLLARVLMSPAFLYRVESAPRGTETPLNDWEMASRMSFFLWSSIPDDELRRAAAARS